MKKITLFLSTVLLFSNSALANSNCFLAKENNQIIKQESQGDSCKLRHAPCSTFKIAISLMGYNEGLLTDETHPELPFKEGYADLVDVWKQPHNPTTWIKNSCVWYSQIITQKLGMTKFQDYVTKFYYGNQNVSGDKGKNNGLTRSWLSSSLQISPQEQMQFLEKLIGNKLPVSSKSYEMTKNILFVETLPGDWKFYGKTGAGDLFNNDGSFQDKQIGWFIGWIEKGSRIIIFVNYIEDQNHKDYSAGKQAKEAARKKLLQLVEDKD